MAKKQRNSPERADAMSRRGAEQWARSGSLRMVGVPAWQNRRTRKPHEHNRQRARRMGT